MDLTSPQFRGLRDIIRDWCGLAIPDSKEYLIQYRLEPVARAAGCENFTQFLDKLQFHSTALLRDEVIEAITTNETSFFRDPAFFDCFRSRILGILVERTRARRAPVTETKIRIWCAGCSTGQEAYSLAMSIHEGCRLGVVQAKPNNFQILATDISSRCLQVAAAGRYTPNQLARGMDDARRRLFLKPDGDVWVFPSFVREMIDYRRINLIENFSQLGVFDAIFCRNVLVYFDDDTRSQVCDRFADALAEGGLFALGAMENLIGLTTRFESMPNGIAMFYRKKK